LVATLKGYWRLLGQQENEKALSIANESDHQVLRCLCHNDVHHLNLVDDGSRLWLLDWEYAAIGDPYFDLASVCCYHNFNAEQRSMLLDFYTRMAVARTTPEMPTYEASSSPPSRGRDRERGRCLNENTDCSPSPRRSPIEGEGVRRYGDERPHDHSLLIDHARLNRMCWLFDYIKDLWFAARKASGAMPDQNSTIVTSSDKSK
jgi:hypothetical protein